MDAARTTVTAARACGIAVACLGAIVLVVGWWAGVEPLRTVIPGLSSMKANTASGFILAGVALISLTSKADSRRRFGVGLGAALAVLGAATVAEYVWGSLGIDELLAPDHGPGGVPGRPSPHTAVSFMFCGLALVAMERPGRVGRSAFLAALIALAASSGIAAVGYLYGVGYLEGSGPVTGMAVHTMAAMLILTAGIALARPDRDPVATILAPTAGGALARQLLPALIIVVLTFGFLRLLSARNGLLDVDIGVTVHVAAMVTTLVVVTLLAAKRLDALIERDEARLRTVIESSDEAFVALDGAGAVTEWNAAAAATFGWPRERAIGRDVAELLVPERHRTRFRAGLAGFRETGGATAGGRRIELEAVRRDGREIPVELTVTAIPGDEGHAISAFVRDISERRELERRRQSELRSAERAALTDELTGLPNRRRLSEHVETAIGSARRQGAAETSTWAVMLDLDNFKRFNDRHGHQAGDRLLREAAAAWRATLRATDFIARYGGEEFVVILPEMSEQGARRAVERLRAAVPQGQTCSAGAVRCSGAEPTAKLLARVDRAMYDAKRAGRDRLVVAG